jgi:hypothetical protein
LYESTRITWLRLVSSKSPRKCGRRSSIDASTRWHTGIVFGQTISHRSELKGYLDATSKVPSSRPK